MQNPPAVAAPHQEALALVVMGNFFRDAIEHIVTRQGAIFDPQDFVAADFSRQYPNWITSELNQAPVAIPARYALERHDWAGAAQLAVRSSDFAYADAPTHVARALGLARTRQVVAARKEIGRLEASNLFLMLMRNGALAGLSTRYAPADRELTIVRDGRVLARGQRHLVEVRQALRELLDRLAERLVLAADDTGRLGVDGGAWFEQTRRHRQSGLWRLPPAQRRQLQPGVSRLPVAHPRLRLRIHRTLDWHPILAPAPIPEPVPRHCTDPAPAP